MIEQIQALIKGLIESEFTATTDYDNALTFISENAQDSTTYNLCKAVLVDIRNEEQKHIGQLNELMKTIDAQQAINIVKGEEEAQEQMLPYIDQIQ